MRDVVGSVFPELMDFDPAGDLFGFYFDETGKLIDPPSGFTLVFFPLNRLKTIPNAICVASGAEKATAISVAAKLGYIKSSP